MAAMTDVMCQRCKRIRVRDHTPGKAALCKRCTAVMMLRADQPEFGREMYALRVQRGLSQREAGDHLYCSPSKINRIENGKAPVSDVDLHLLLAAYEVTDRVQVEMLTKLAMAQTAYAREKARVEANQRQANRRGPSE